MSGPLALDAFPSPFESRSHTESTRHKIVRSRMRICRSPLRLQYFLSKTSNLEDIEGSVLGIYAEG
jgi:hypothetical protein